MIEAGHQVGGAGRLDLVEPGGQPLGARRAEGACAWSEKRWQSMSQATHREAVAAVHLADQRGGQRGGRG